MTKFNIAITPERQVHNDWGDLGFTARLKFWFWARYLAFTCKLREDLMSKLPRIAVLVMIGAYIVFFTLYADRLGPIGFVAGLVLGLALGGLAVYLVFPRNHNGNHNEHHNGDT